jgi:hypothetical protein
LGFYFIKTNFSKPLSGRSNTERKDYLWSYE